MLIKLETNRPFKRNEGNHRYVGVPLPDLSNSRGEFRAEGLFSDTLESCRVWTAPDNRPLKDRTFFVQSLNDGWQTIYKGKVV